MKFKCLQQDIIKKLNIVSKAVSSRTTIPSLKWILMEVKDNKLKMTASDMDITIETVMEVKDAEDGVIAVPAKLFGDMVRSLPEDEVTFSESEGTLNIKCKDSNSYIVGFPGDDFPVIKNEKESKENISVNKEIFSEMVRKTSFAVSLDQTKGVITGILFEVKKDYIRMVAIDGVRMAVYTKPEVNEKETSFIISGRLMNEIGKILNETDDSENVEIYYDGKTAIFITDDIKASVRMIAGEFIKYNDLIPKESKIDVVIKKKEFIEAVERASILSEGKNNLIKTSVRGNVLTIASNSEEGGTVEDVLVNKTGDDIEIGFNAKFVKDVLKVIDDEEIVLKMNSAITPCTVTPVMGDTYTYLILPVRINS